MVGEGFIKEVDFGRVWLRLNEAPDDEKDAVVAEWKGDAKAFLKTTLVGIHLFHLCDSDNEWFNRRVLTLMHLWMNKTGLIQLSWSKLDTSLYLSGWSQERASTVSSLIFALSKLLKISSRPRHFTCYAR